MDSYGLARAHQTEQTAWHTKDARFGDRLISRVSYGFLLFGPVRPSQAKTQYKKETVAENPIDQQDFMSYEVSNEKGFAREARNLFQKRMG